MPNARGLVHDDIWPRWLQGSLETPVVVLSKEYMEDTKNQIGIDEDCLIGRV